MGRFGWLVLGVVVGGALVFGGQRYHVLRTKDGLAVVPKVSATFSETYVDVRDYGAAEWAAHRSLAAAVVQADRQDLIKEGVLDKVRGRVDGFLNELGRLGDKDSE